MHEVCVSLVVLCVCLCVCLCLCVNVCVCVCVCVLLVWASALCYVQIFFIIKIIINPLTVFDGEEAL